MVFVTVDIPVRVLSIEDAEPTEVFFFELNLHKKKWLVSCSYTKLKPKIILYRDYIRLSK